MIIKKLGIRYMGSKRNIANDLVNYILEHNPNTEYVYDLFGGVVQSVLNSFSVVELKRLFIMN